MAPTSTLLPEATSQSIGDLVVTDTEVIELPLEESKLTHLLSDIQNCYKNPNWTPVKLALGQGVNEGVFSQTDVDAAISAYQKNHSDLALVCKGYMNPEWVTGIPEPILERVTQAYKDSRAYDALNAVASAHISPQYVADRLDWGLERGVFTEEEVTEAIMAHYIKRETNKDLRKRSQPKESVHLPTRCDMDY